MNMKCKNTRKRFDEYRENILAPAIKKRVTDHLNSCDCCARYFSEQLDLLALCKKIDSPIKSKEEWEKLRGAVLADVFSQPLHSNAGAQSLTWWKNILGSPARRSFRFAYAALTVFLAIGAVFLFLPRDISIRRDSGQGDQKAPPLSHAFSLVTSQRTIIIKKNIDDTIRPMQPSGVLEKGDALQTLESGGALVRLDDKSAVRVMERSLLEIRSTSAGDQRYYIASGEAVFRVGKRGPGGRFSVSTPNAKCSVVGTLFKVKVTWDSIGRKPLTELVVAEGSVDFGAAIGENVHAIVSSGTFMTIDGNSPSIPDAVPSKEKTFREFDSLTTAVPADIPWSAKDSVREESEKEPRAAARLVKAGPSKESNASPGNKRAVENRVLTDSSAANKVSASDSAIILAESLYDSNKDQSALEIALPLATGNAADSAVCIKALSLMQRIYARQHRFEAEASVMEKLCALNIPELRKEMLLFEIASIKASDLHKYEEANAGLKRYLLKYPSGRFAEEALLKSAELSFITKDYTQAKEKYQSYADRYPKGGGAMAAADKMAYLCDVMYHDYPGAIGWYGRIIDNSSEDSDIANACFWRAQCWKKLGDAGKALRGYQDYVSRFPQGKWEKEARKNIQTNGFASTQSVNRAP
jgi:TolA-binding protein